MKAFIVALTSAVCYCYFLSTNSPSLSVVCNFLLLVAGDVITVIGDRLHLVLKSQTFLEKLLEDRYYFLSFIYHKQISFGPYMNPYLSVVCIFLLWVAGDIITIIGDRLYLVFKAQSTYGSCLGIITILYQLYIISRDRLGHICTHYTRSEDI